MQSSGINSQIQNIDTLFISKINEAYIRVKSNPSVLQELADYFTFSVPGSTSATIDNDNGAGLRVGICLAGSTDNEAPDSTAWSTTRKDLTDTQGNFLSSTSNILYITGVQLEAGTTASDFEFLPYDVNYTRCLRYFVRRQRPENGSDQTTVGTGTYNSTTEIFSLLTVHTPMRAEPSVSYSNLSHFDIEPFDAAPTTIEAAVQSTSFQPVLRLIDPSARTKGFCSNLVIDVNDGFLDLSAEL